MLAVRDRLANRIMTPKEKRGITPTIKATHCPAITKTTTRPKSARDYDSHVVEKQNKAESRRLEHTLHEVFTVIARTYTVSRLRFWREHGGEWPGGGEEVGEGEFHAGLVSSYQPAFLLRLGGWKIRRPFCRVETVSPRFFALTLSTHAPQGGVRGQ